MNSSQKLGGLRRANRIAAHYEHVSAVQALCMVLCGTIMQPQTQRCFCLSLFVWCSWAMV